MFGNDGEQLNANKTKYKKIVSYCGLTLYIILLLLLLLVVVVLLLVHIYKLLR